MTKTKWIMKQYWRIGTIRTLLALALGMFVLGKQYYEYIPYLADLGLLGALILGASLVLLFLGIGWAYDEKGKFWSPKMQVNAERSPYQYVPDYKTYGFIYPVYYAVLATLRKTFEKHNLNAESIKSLSQYLDEWFERKETRSDIFGALPASIEISNKYSFVTDPEELKRKIPIKSRVKLGFETEMLRLNWIQALTGLVQDVLIFGALYVTLLFPDVVSEGLVPVNYLLLGILYLSLPLFFILTAAGWYYDKKLRVWSADYVVNFERNQFQYVPDPRNGIIEIPYFLVLLKSMNEIFDGLELDKSKLTEMIQFLEKYITLSSSIDQHMDEARALRKEIDATF
ncbi:MAG: hypothetical protein ACFFDQ_11150 [Candidatus Thorarchaeota archaeon]